MPKKKSDKAHLVPEDFFRELFENTFDGIAYCQMIFDDKENPVDWIYLEVNKNFEKLTGLKNSVGHKVTELIPQIHIFNSELFEIYGRVSLTGKQERFEVYLAPLARWFLISVYSSKKKFFVAIFQNITEQKLLEKNLENAKIAARNVLADLTETRDQLEQAKAKDEAILDSVGDGMIVVDKDRKIIFFSKSAQEMTGWTGKAALGRHTSEVIQMEDEKGNPIPMDQRPIHLALSKEEKITTSVNTYNFVSKSGNRFPAAITATPVIYGKDIIGAILIFRDITKEKEIDQAKSEFISLASHQLKTPLSAIKLVTERLLSHKIGPLTEKQEEYFGDIRSSNQRMIDLVNDLLNVSRIEVGAFTIRVSQGDPGAIVRSILDELKSVIDKKQLKLETSFPEKSIVLILDEPLFRMVINNLVINAIHYTPEGGKIRVECQVAESGQTLGGKVLEENYFVVVVSDTGCGIPKNQQSQIFSKFFRADNARQARPDGTGLGLYIVKSILDHSGGLVWFESTENQGTTFYVAFPSTGMKAESGKKELMV